MSDEKPEDTSNCLSPERQIKRARKEASSPIEINTKTDESTDRPLPGFVAGLIFRFLSLSDL
jgi:hypothetical protein